MSDERLGPVCFSGEAADCLGIGTIRWCEGWICQPCLAAERLRSSDAMKEQSEIKEPDYQARAETPHRFQPWRLNEYICEWCMRLIEQGRHTSKGTV